MKELNIKCFEEATEKVKEAILPTWDLHRKALPDRTEQDILEQVRMSLSSLWPVPSVG